MATMTASEAISFLTSDSDYLLSEPLITKMMVFGQAPMSYPIVFQLKTKTCLCMLLWWYNAVNQFTIKYKLSYFMFTSFTVANNSNSGIYIFF